MAAWAGRWTLVLLLASSAARAEGPLSPIPPGPDVIEPLRQGQVAPFTGALFDLNTATRWGNYLEQCRTRLKADVELERRLGEVELEKVRGTFQVQLQLNQTAFAAQQLRVSELEKQLSQPPAFYRTWWFGLTVGVVGSAAVGYFGYQALR